MDTSKYIKKCPRCQTEIEPKRHATAGDKFIAGVMGLGGAIIGFTFGGPLGAAAGAAAAYQGGKASVMSIENDHDQSQWFKYKCPKCGIEWKEKIHTNDDPDDPSWMTNAPY